MWFKNKEGSKFNKLTIIKFSFKKRKQSGNLSYYWLCRCDCGTEKVIEQYQITSGNTKSCGCTKHLTGKENKFFRHGMGKTRFYKIWTGIKQRCNNKKNPGYKDYGGRGIKICERWSKFDNFHYDMYESYNKHCEEFGIKNTSIDRKNNSKNYNPSNCRWATRIEQNNNQRSNTKFKKRYCIKCKERIIGWMIKRKCKKCYCKVFHKKYKKLYGK